MYSSAFSPSRGSKRPLTMKRSGYFFGHLGVALDGIETVLVKILQIGRLHDGHIIGSFNEQVVVEIVLAVFFETGSFSQTCSGGLSAV